MSHSGTIFTQFFFLFSILFYLGLAVLVVYCLVLFIRLATRGIKALDIYLVERKNG